MKSEIEKISLNKCKSVLEKDGSNYSNEELLEIRTFLYLLANLDYEVYLKEKIREQEFEEIKQKTKEDNLKLAA